MSVKKQNSTTQNSSAPEASGDAVQTKLPKGLQTVADNIKTIIIGLIIVVLGVGGYAIYDFMDKNKKEKARQDLGKILSLPLKERVEELNKYLETASSPKMLIPAQLELATALSEEKKHEEAAKIWGELAASQAGQMQVVATLNQAAELTSAQKYNQAATLLASLAEAAPQGYRVIIYQRLGYVLEEAGDLKTAVLAWKLLEHYNEAGDRPFIPAKIISLEEKIAKMSAAEEGAGQDLSTLGLKLEQLLAKEQAKTSVKEGE